MVRQKQKCEICGEHFGQLANHVKNSHNISKKAYYDKFVLLDKIPKCKCGNPLVFKNIREGYSKNCSSECGRKNGKFIGVNNSFSRKEVKDKIKITNLNKFGVDNPAKNKDIQRKIKVTNLERYDAVHKNASMDSRVANRESYYDTFIVNLKVKNIIPLFSKEEYLEHLSHYTFNCLFCGEDFVFNTSKYGLRTTQINCSCPKGSSTSKAEDEISKEIKKYILATSLETATLALKINV